MCTFIIWQCFLAIDNLFSLNLASRLLKKLKKKSFGIVKCLVSEPT